MNGTDIALLDLLNFDGGPFLDSLMLLLSEKLVWIPLYLAAFVVIARSRGMRCALWILVLCCLAVLLADQTCGILKRGLQFLRPNHTPGLMETLHRADDYVGGLYGTASSHAANGMAVALITSAAVRRRWYTLLMILWLSAVCLSRVYLGFHFPSQIILGLAVGALFAVPLRLVYRRRIEPPGR